MQKQQMIGTSVSATDTPSLTGNINWLLLAAVILTFTNGLVISLVIFPAVSDPVGLENYGDGWAQIAENVVRGNGFVYDPEQRSTEMTGYLKREPLYALFLASILFIFGKLDPYMMLFQTTISSITCFVLYFIVRKTFNPRVALLASFLYALYPFASWYVPRIAYETLLGLVVSLLVLGLVYLFDRLSFRRAATVGLLLGITVLCRGIYLLFPLALLPSLIIRFNVRYTSVIRCWLTVLIMMMVVMSPWVFRNYSVSGEFVAATTHGGVNYFFGNKVIEYHSLGSAVANEKAEQEYSQLYKEVRDSISKKNPTLSHAQVEAQVDKKLMRMALADILAHPFKFLEKMLKGLIFVWFRGDTTLKSTALFLMQGPLVLLCGIGLFCALRVKKQVLPLLTVLLYFTVIQAAFLPYGRYSYPMVPILIAFAAYAIETVRARYLYNNAVSTA